MQNLYFQFVHSDWLWVDAGKMMKNLFLHPDHQEGQNIGLHEKSKIQKYKNIAAFKNCFDTDLFFLEKQNLILGTINICFYPHQIFFR